MKKIIFPGWAVPLDLYSEFEPDYILDFGFFKNQSSKLNSIDCPIDSIKSDDLKNSIPQDDLHIIAHSLGSLPALMLATELKNIKKISIFAGFAKFTQSDDSPHGKPASGINMMQGMMGLACAMVLSKFFNEMTKPSDFVIKALPKPNSSELKKGLELLKSEDLRQILPEINIPVAIFHGKDDAIVNFKLAEELDNLLPDSSLKLIENAGHALPFTHNEYTREI